MAETLNLGTNGNWATKKESLLAYNSENNNFKPLPFTFDRSTSATRVNKQGLIEVVSNNEPRIDFLNDSKGALKLEPSRSNYILKSDDVLSTYQSQNGNVSDASEPINGFNNSIQIEYDASNSLVYKRDFTPTIGTEYTISCFVQMNDNSEPIHTVDVNSGDFCLINNNSFASASDIKTERLGSTNIYRVSSTRTATSTNNRFGIIKYSTQSSKGFKVTGLQLEQGSYATSYIPTSGGAVTRDAEICEGAGNEQVFNDSEGVIYVETQPFIDGDFTSVYISLSDNTTGTNFITIQHRDSGQLRVYAGNFSTIIFLQDIDMSENLKIALQYENITDFKLYVNGISYPIYSTPTNSAFVGLNTFDFKLRGSASGYWLGQVKEAKYFNTALTDQELISLTS